MEKGASRSLAWHLIDGLESVLQFSSADIGVSGRSPELAATGAKQPSRQNGNSGLRH